MLSIVIQGVTMLSVILASVVMLCVIALFPLIAFCCLSILKRKIAFLAFVFKTQTVLIRN
jgi:hypothetical protein